MAKTCPSCGAPIQATAENCPYCGMILSKEKGETRQAQQQISQNQSSSACEDDKNSVGIKILSFFIPVAGFILWAIWRNQYPKKARNAAKWAGIGIGVTMAVEIICLIITGVL